MAWSCQFTYHIKTRHGYVSNRKKKAYHTQKKIKHKKLSLDIAHISQGSRKKSVTNFSLENFKLKRSFRLNYELREFLDNKFEKFILSRLEIVNELKWDFFHEISNFCQVQSLSSRRNFVVAKRIQSQIKRKCRSSFKFRFQLH